MKKLILLCVTLTQFCTTNAQYVSPDPIPLNNFKVVDSARLSITYQLRYPGVVLTKEGTQVIYEDTQTLLVGTHCSKYYSQDLLDCSIAWQEKTTREYPKMGTCSFEIFKNYPDGSLTFTDQTSTQEFGGIYMYDEPMPKFNWKIEEDTMTVQTYLCQKATTSFRGRNYTAWFAPDIPTSDGPWKFCGLPGLILKIEDSEKRYHFECTGIAVLRMPQAVKFYQLMYIKTTRVELDKTYRRLFKDPIEFWKEIHSENCGQITRDMISELVYSPIELE